MDGLGTAANVLAVLDLTVKITTLVFQYYSSVKNAKPDIKRLIDGLEGLKANLEGALELLEGPNGDRLRTSHSVRGKLEDCSAQLGHLESRLQKRLERPTITGKVRVMSRFDIRALKWPFERKDVDVIIENLERYQNTLHTALTIDQTAQVFDIAQKIVLTQLPNVKNAAFDSHADEHDLLCHPKTRIALLNDITRWSQDPNSETIFWLSGMAGTGKSTISRTMAMKFADEGVLGASFFFKRGERDRGNAAHLFTTIAFQLVKKEAALAASIKDAIEKDSSIMSRSFKQQFEELVLKPLGGLNIDLPKPKTVVFLIDALDECEHDEDIKLIIYLLSQADLPETVRLRVLLTSRPELPIRLGFSNIHGKYQDLVLHHIPVHLVKQDLMVYLQHELQQIRNDFNILSPVDRHLAKDWPGNTIIEKLAQMAVPLFIFAATICRFVGDRAWCDPEGQLEKVLKYSSTAEESEIDKLDATYGPILDRLAVGSRVAQRVIVEEFRAVVGSIVLLAEPLSASSLSSLLDIPKSTIDRRLMSLHSVLNVPASSDAAIRPLHLSFRDFLVDPEKRHTNRFWIDEKATHGMIASRCPGISSI